MNLWKKCSNLRQYSEPRSKIYLTIISLVVSIFKMSLSSCISKMKKSKSIKKNLISIKKSEKRFMLWGLKLKLFRQGSSESLDRISWKTPLKYRKKWPKLIFSPFWKRKAKITSKSRRNGFWWSKSFNKVRKKAELMNKDT